MKVVQSFGQGAQAAPLRVSLCDINPDMTDAWLDSFFGVAAVEIVQGDLLDAGGEAVVSPANSFGDMSGGVDKRIDDFYHGAAQENHHAANSRPIYGRAARRHGDSSSPAERAGFRL